jgi:hypothetical protein
MIGGLTWAAGGKAPPIIKLELKLIDLVFLEVDIVFFGLFKNLIPANTAPPIAPEIKKVQ